MNPAQVHRGVRSRRPARGLTFIELLVSLAIIGVLAGMAYSYVIGQNNGVNGRNSILEVYEELKLTRSRALSQGVQAVFLLQPISGSNPQLQYIAFLDLAQSFNPATPTFALPTGDQLIDQNTLDSSVSFNSVASYMTALAAPFQSVPATTACTFCDVTADYVTVVFRSDGTPALGSLSSTYTFGGSFTLASNINTGRANSSSLYSMQTIVISALTGEIFNYVRFGT